LAFLRAPSKVTGPGEPVDLGEIGQVMFEDQRIERERAQSLKTKNVTHIKLEPGERRRTRRIVKSCTSGIHSRIGSEI